MRGRLRVRTPKLPSRPTAQAMPSPPDSGPLYASDGSAATAMARAAASVFGILERRGADIGADEMALVEAQDELVNPSACFRAEPL